MIWTIEYTATARKQLHKFDRQIAQRIDCFLQERVATLDQPQALGKALTGPLGGLWHYRVGDYRVVCDLQDAKLTVLVLRIGHRRQVYR